MKSRRPHTTGDEFPAGASTRHATFVLGSNCTGGRASSAASPSPPGPRNCGHCASAANEVATQAHAARKTVRTAGVESTHRMKEARGRIGKLGSITFRDTTPLNAPCDVAGNCLRRILRGQRDLKVI